MMRMVSFLQGLYPLYSFDRVPHYKEEKKQTLKGAAPPFCRVETAPR